MPEDVPVPGRSFPSSWLEQRLAALSDARLTLLVALALFVLSAWPLLLVDLPPFQDLPNHVATAHIIAHPDLYPQFAFNGLFKSNALLTLWFYVLGSHGLFGAARAVRRDRAGRERARAAAVPAALSRDGAVCSVAMLFAWPLVHSFSGRDGVPELRVRVRAVADPADRARSPARSAPPSRAASASPRSSGVIWYAHPFPLAIVGRAGRAARRHPLDLARARVTAGVALLLPLAPGGPAVARGRAPAPGQGRARHADGGRHVLLPEPVGDRSRTCGPTSRARSRGGEA